MNLRHFGYRAYQCVFGLGARLLARLAELVGLVGLSGDSEADRANAFIDAIFAMNARLGIPARLHLHPGGGSAADGGVGGQGGQSHLPRAGDL